MPPMPKGVGLGEKVPWSTAICIAKGISSRA